MSFLFNPLEFRGVYQKFVEVSAFHVYFIFEPHICVNPRETSLAGESTGSAHEHHYVFGIRCEFLIVALPAFGYLSLQLFEVSRREIS